MESFAVLLKSERIGCALGKSAVCFVWVRITAKSFVQGAESYNTVFDGKCWFSGLEHDTVPESGIQLFS